MTCINEMDDSVHRREPVTGCILQELQQDIELIHLGASCD